MEQDTIGGTRGSHTLPRAQSSQSSLAQARLQDADNAGAEVRSGYGSGFGAEFPAAVYESIVIAFGCMLAAAWLTFGGRTDSDVDLGVVTILCAVFLMLPVLMYRTGATRSDVKRTNMKQFLSARFETATGALPAREAWLQVALIPIALAVAAMLFGGVYAWVG